MADTTNPFGGASSGGGGGMFGGGMWGSSPYGGFSGGFGGGYGGMQSPYGGGYGGFGGGYGMPQGYGGYGGGYGGMGSPYGGFGGGMPYGGGYGAYGGYDMQQQSAYGPYSTMPQQQTMMASGAAPQTMAAASESGDAPADGGVTPNATGDEALRNLNIGGNTSNTTTNAPWKPQAIALERLWQGSGAGQYPSGTDPNITGVYKELEKQQGLGALGFDPNSEAALQRMQALAGGPNPLLDASLGATQDVASGQANIGTGGMFQSLYRDPGIQNLGQYQDMYSNPNIGGMDQYARMAGQNAIGNEGQYNQLLAQPGTDSSRMQSIYGGPGVDTAMYQGLRGAGAQQDYYANLYNNNFNSIGTGNYQDILGGSQGQGSLAGGMFGQMAGGDLVNANPYREKAIQDAMDQTGDQVKATMSSRGRYGSDAYGDAMGKALGQVATQARMQGYDTDTANMMQAAQARSGEALARQGVGLQAAQGIAGAQGQNYQNLLGAAGGLANVQQGNLASQLAATNAIAAAQGTNVANRMGAAQSLMNVGSTDYQNRLAAMQGLSGIQGTNYQSQLGALGQMNAAQQMRNQQMMAAAQGLTGAQGQNWQNQLGAAQGLTGINSQDLQNRLAAAGMAPAMQGLRYDDSQRLLQAGMAREAMAQQQRDFGWNQLNRYATLAGNVPGTAGTSKDSGAPWWQNALGAAAVGASIWGAVPPTV